MFSETSAIDKNNSIPETVREHAAPAAQAAPAGAPPSTSTSTITTPSSSLTCADAGNICQDRPSAQSEQPAPSAPSKNKNSDNHGKTNNKLKVGSSQMTSPQSSSTQAHVRYGKCKWFNVAKGWGFITPNDGGVEVFVHQSVIQMTGFRSLGAQEDVEFEAVVTPRGVEATRVAGREGIDCVGSSVRPRPHGIRFVRRVRCYNCNKFNHIAADCRLEPQPRRCYLCQQDDHLIANCPRNKTQAKEASLDINQESTIEKEQQSIT